MGPHFKLSSVLLENMRGLDHSVLLYACRQRHTTTYFYVQVFSSSCDKLDIAVQCRVVVALDLDVDLVKEPLLH